MPFEKGHKGYKKESGIVETNISAGSLTPFLGNTATLPTPAAETPQNSPQAAKTTTVEPALKRPAKSRVIDRPFLYTEDARLSEWQKEWPGCHFCLVHNVDFKTGQKNDYPVMEYEAKGFVVLSEDPKVVRHPGHVLMGINEEYWNEVEADRVNRSNRTNNDTQSETQRVGDGEVEAVSIRKEVGAIGDLLGE